MILTILLIRQGPAGMGDPASAVAADSRRCIAALEALAPSTCMAMKVSKVLTVGPRNIQGHTVLG